VDAPGWSHYWRKGGPMLLAKLTSRWSHVTGGRQVAIELRPFYLLSWDDASCGQLPLIMMGCR
jgi:hypothetical protein